MGSCQHDFTVDKDFCCATPLPPLHLKWSRSVHVEGARHMKLHSMSSLAAASDGKTCGCAGSANDVGYCSGKCCDGAADACVNSDGTDGFSDSCCAPEPLQGLEASQPVLC